MIQKNNVAYGCQAPFSNETKANIGDAGTISNFTNTKNHHYIYNTNTDIK